MATNDLLPFGTGAGANVLSQISYAALAARSTGFQAGTANSPELNKAWRQAAFAAAMIGQFTADNSGDNVVDNGDIAAFEASFLKALQILFPRQATANVTLYVRTDGNDTTGDGSANTAAKAFATIAAAITYGLRRFSFAGFALNIQLGNPGTYAAPGVIRSSTVVNITGDVANQANYVVSGAGTSGSIVFGSSGADVNIFGLTIANNGTIAHTTGALTGGRISYQNVTFTQTGGFTSFSLFICIGGIVTINTGCIISAGQYAAALNASLNGQIGLAGTLSVTGLPNFTTVFCQLNSCATLGVYGGATITGSATGARYAVSTNAVANVNGAGANFFPGNAPGATATGGQYV